MARVWLDGSDEPRWARAVFSERSDGDFSVGDPSVPDSSIDPALRRDRDALTGGAPWTWLQQVHGAEVVHVEEPGQHAGRRGDSLVTSVPGAVLAVHTADCAPVLMVGTGPGVRVVAAAHAGWRGVLEGVLEATVESVRSLGADSIQWRLGPCISPSAYEFGRADLDRLVERYGVTVESRTSQGSTALDLAEAVRRALDLEGVEESVDPDGVPCTASSQSYHSWRARRDPGRQASAVWIEAASRP